LGLRAGRRKERSVGSSILSLLHPLPPQQQLVVHTLITHCNYTLPPLPSANRVVDSSQTNESTISASTKPTTSHSRHLQSSSEESSPSRSNNHHNQRVCCDHQFTDLCSVRESPTRPRSSLLRLDPQASPDGASRLRLRLAHTSHTAHPHVRNPTRITFTPLHAHYLPSIRSAPRRQDEGLITPSGRSNLTTYRIRNWRIVINSCRSLRLLIEPPQPDTFLYMLCSGKGIYWL
jgi:hypothetical protein